MSRHDYPKILVYDRDKAIRIIIEARKKAKRLSKTNNITDYAMMVRADAIASWIELELMLSNKLPIEPKPKKGHVQFKTSWGYVSFKKSKKKKEKRIAI